MFKFQPLCMEHQSVDRSFYRLWRVYVATQNGRSDHRKMRTDLMPRSRDQLDHDPPDATEVDFRINRTLAHLDLL